MKVRKVPDEPGFWVVWHLVKGAYLSSTFVKQSEVESFEPKDCIMWVGPLPIPVVFADVTQWDERGNELEPDSFLNVIDAREYTRSLEACMMTVTAPCELRSNSHDTDS